MMRLRNIMPFVFIFFLFVGKINAQIDENITVQQLNDFLKQLGPSKMVLDVRTEQEYAQGYINGALNYNYLAENFKEKVGKLDKTSTYYVYCFSGGRSAQAVADMKALGFTKVFNVNGGIRAWTEAGYNIKDE